MAHDRHPLFLNPPSRASRSPLYRTHDLPLPNSMAPLASLQDANVRILKRSFTADSIHPPLHGYPTGSSSESKWARIPGARLQRVSTDSGHRRKRSYTNMPSAAGPRMYENHIPSFMSIYDMDASLIENPNLLQLSTKPPGTITTSYSDQQTRANLQTDLSGAQENDHRNTIIHHQHHESTSTTSDSTDSSPTTTISTVDSSSLSDPSPSSSPESPVTLVPLSSFAGSTFGDSFHGFKMNENNLMRPSFSHERPMTSPSPRKFKNPKSLALNLNPIQPSSELQQTSEPSSPSFIKPPPLKARKKPSLLSLNTGPALSLEPLASPSVPTMLQRRGLKHSISSPQILATPGFGPSGGMSFGKPKPLGPSRFKDLSLSTKTFTITEDSHEAPTGVQMATRVPGVSVGGDSFDRPHTGEDAKSASYPEGPILMHEPSVHLYSEPNVDEALNFDVIINVAREVKNPFVVADAAKGPQTSFPSSISEPATSPESAAPDTAMSFASFRTAFEMQPPSGSSESSPTTPKASLDAQRPEYVHVPWDHNTDVKDELWDLCQLIESRTKEGKRVLVHCQQGASRSATLIIAYGMYIHKDMSATEAYALAQSKSRWVNPNMSLLFSLNDFKKVIDERKNGEVETTSNRKPPTRHRPTLSAVTSDAPPTPSRARGNSTPGTARDKVVSRPDDSPVPTHSAIERLGSFDFGFDQMSINSPQQQRETRAPAPAPAPRVLPPPHRRAPEPPISNMDERVRPVFQQPPRAAFREFPRLHNPEPSRTTITEFPRPSIGNEYEELMSPRISEMTNNPLKSFSRSFTTTEEEAPPTPSLFSPRTFEFPRNAFFPQETQAAPPPPKTVDPRSPPMKGEAPITRSIDDVL